MPHDATPCTYLWILILHGVERWPGDGLGQDLKSATWTSEAQYCIDTGRGAIVRLCDQPRAAKIRAVSANRRAASSGQWPHRVLRAERQAVG